MVIRTGIVLPTFRDAPDAAFDAAAVAVAAGVDGVFCYDHIWPLGQPERPALAPFPVLGALATRLGPPRGPGEGPFLGTLVARVGLVPDEVLAAQFVALEALAPGRVIAGLGTGDRLSEQENRAYGIEFPPAADRRAELVALARRLVRCGIPVWVAGGPAARTEEARAAGAALNLWDADPALVAERAAGPDALEVTWAGPPPAPSTLDDTVGALHRAGADWAVFAWPLDVKQLVDAARCRGEVRWSGLRGVGFRDGVPPDQRAAALRLRHHQRPQGDGAASRPRRDRPRLREPGPALARRGGGEAGRGGPQPAQPPLFRFSGHPQAAQRDRRPVPTQVRRRARPRDRGRDDHRG